MLHVHEKSKYHTKPILTDKVDNRLIIWKYSTSFLSLSLSDLTRLTVLRPCFYVVISIIYSICSSAQFSCSVCFGHQVYFWWLHKLMKHITLDQQSFSDFSLNIACFSCLGKSEVNITCTSSEIHYSLPLQQLSQSILLYEK